MVISQNQILTELGITYEKNTKTLDDLLEEQTTEGTLLKFIVDSEVFVPCFPLAHMTIGDPDHIGDAFEGKGHQAYYEFLMSELDKEENENDEEENDDGEPLTRKEKEQRKKNRTLRHLKSLPSPLLKGQLPNLDVLNKLDYVGNCTKETNCVLLRKYGNKLYGRPCPVLMFKFLNYIAIYQDYVFGYLNTMDGALYDTPDSIETYHLAMIITNARIKTFDDFKLSTHDNIMTVSKDGLQVSKDQLASNTTVDAQIYNNFKTVGIDILELSKAQLKNSIKKIATTSSGGNVVSANLPKVQNLLDTEVISISVVNKDDDD